MRPLLSLAIVFVVVALTGCAGKSDHPRASYTMNTRAQDIQAIRQLAAAWRTAWLDGDVEFILSLYSDDPILMPQDQPAVVGKAAIRELLQSALANYSITSDSTLREVVASGDWGYFWSSYNLTATPKDGSEPIHSVGKSLFIVKREPGNVWKISRLIDNSDGPQEPEGNNR